VKEFVDRFRNDNDRNLAEFERLENKKYSVPVWASGNYLIAVCPLSVLPNTAYFAEILHLIPLINCTHQVSINQN